MSSERELLEGAYRDFNARRMEEILARRTKEVPFNLQKELKKRAAAYTKALLPLTSKVCQDKNLVTGQNPFSSKELAAKVITALKIRALFH